MFGGVGARLLASYLLLIALAMGLLCPYLLLAFRQFYLEWIESGVRARSLAIADTVGALMEQPQQSRRENVCVSNSASHRKPTARRLPRAVS